MSLLNDIHAIIYHEEVVDYESDDSGDDDFGLFNY